ncbi:FUSC family protein [Amycolatopsis magusensis]|uniref:Membrane protein YccC n=1 Tax=Amycolatopsis magusensis TaxID=882444 RepID=A0ABS4PJ02_9PSEU|nr:FUSC family protein [Amycolatopsis magusensis]MBP2179401.1 putative membrane protein YccC [Amycolatopsis magusensis]
MSSRDLSAPNWLVHLLRSKPDPLPWTRAIRAPIALAVPLAIGFALGDITLGAVVSTGALPTVLSEAAGPYRYRARRITGAAVAAFAGYAAGLFSGGNPAASIPVVIVVAALSALISAAGSNASIAALQMFVFCVLGTGQHLLGVQLEISLLCFVVGSAWGLTVALFGWTVRATTPERTAVTQVFIELAAMLSAEDEDTQRAARHQLTSALNTAYDRLLTARSWLSGRDETYRRLLTVLSASTPAVEASVAMVNAGERPPRELVDYLVRLATAVRMDAELPPVPELDIDEPMALALRAGLVKIGKGKERKRREPVPLRKRLRDWLSSLAGPVTWTAALRLTLCVAIAEVVSLLVPFERSYWITLTVGIVLKPDFGSVFGRAVLRGLGTVAGVTIGAAVLGLGAQGWWLVGFSALFAAGVAIGKVRNYGLLATFVTPLIILQMDLSSHGDWAVVLARLVDTVLGCAIVLLFGYLLWPGSMRPRVGGQLADALDSVTTYAGRALEPVDSAEDRAERSRARRRAYRALADLRTTFQQVIVEPSAAGRQAVAWWPVIVEMERLTDAITEVVVTVEHGAPPPEPREVEHVTAALTELAAAVREQRDPASMAMPRGAQLSGVVDGLTAVFDAVRGPDLTERSPMRFVRRFLIDRWT